MKHARINWTADQVVDLRGWYASHPNFSTMFTAECSMAGIENQDGVEICYQAQALA